MYKKDKIAIKQIIENKSEEVIEVSRLPINDYVNYLEELGIVKIEHKYNGYQVDFEIYFLDNDRNLFILKGDLWYEKDFLFYKEDYNKIFS